MMELSLFDWCIIGGIGGVWLGVQIVLVGGLPRQLRRGEVPSAAKGTPEAFGLFWLDQYSYIGLSSSVIGVALTAIGIAYS